MKIAIEDECQKTFKEFKFRNIEARYLVFKIEKEVVVTVVPFRSLIASARRRKPGMTSSHTCLLRSSASAYSTWNSPTRTTCTSAKCFSAIGVRTVLLSRCVCCTRQQNKTSGLTSISMAKK